VTTPLEVLQPEAALAAPRRVPTRRPSLLLAAGGIIVAAAAALPTAYLLIRSGTAGLTVLGDTLLSAKTAGLLLRTTLLCVAVTATAIVISVPLAWLTVRTDLPGRRTWVVVSALPLVIPSFVGGYAFVAALGPRGIVQGWLEPFGVDRLPSIYGFGGAWLVLTLFTYPLVLLPVRAALGGLDPALEEAARSLGRSRLSTLLRVTVPQLRPAIVSGGLLIALYTLSDFGAVSLLRFDSFTRAIYVAYRSSFDRSAAAILGLVLIALAALVFVAEARTRGRAVYYAAHRGAQRRPRVTRLGPWRWPAFAICAALVTVALLVPIGVIVLWLVRGATAGESFGFAFGAALRSVEASLLGATAGLVCAWPVAYLSARYPGRLGRSVEGVSYAGYTLPGIVVALALVFFGARYTPVVYQTLGILTFAYVVHFLPQATGTLRASIAQVHPGIEEAARSLGASPREVLRRITLPLVRPGALTAFALLFLTIMKELPATLLLAPTGFSTLATEVWDAASAASFAQAAAPALALVLLSSAPMALLVVREGRAVSPTS
jgi:iron(III) transport system permease protein